MGVPMKGYDFNHKLYQLIDWNTDNDPITEENTQKVVSFIENHFEDSNDFFEGGFEGPFRLKKSTDLFEMMNELQKFYRYCKDWEDRLSERNRKFDGIDTEGYESLTEDDKVEYSEIGGEWYDLDKDWGRFPYDFILQFFDTDVTEIYSYQFVKWLFKHSMEEEFIEHTNEVIFDFEKRTNQKIGELNPPTEPSKSEDENIEIYWDHLRDLFGLHFITVDQSLINWFDDFVSIPSDVLKDRYGLCDLLIHQFESSQMDRRLEMERRLSVDITNRWLSTFGGVQ